MNNLDVRLFLIFYLFFGTLAMYFLVVTLPQTLESFPIQEQKTVVPIIFGSFYGTLAIMLRKQIISFLRRMFVNAP